LILHGSIREEISHDFEYFIVDLVLVLCLETGDAVIDLSLCVSNFELSSIDFVEDEGGVLDLSHALDDVLVFELGKRHVVDDREQGEFAADDGDDIVVRWWEDAQNLLFQAIFPEDLHLTVEDVVVVELQQLLVSEVNAELLETVLLEVLETEDIEDVDLL
jgi:hypothetical protein